MLDASLIILIGFILFMSLVFRFGYRKSLKALDSKIDEIKKLLDHAELARRQSEVEVEKEKTFAHEAEADINSLKENVTQQIADIQAQATQELDRLMASKAENAKLVLDRLRTHAVHQLKEEITNAALHLIKTITSHELKAEDQEKMNQHFLEMIDHVSGEEDHQKLKKKLAHDQKGEKQVINF